MTPWGGSTTIRCVGSARIVGVKGCRVGILRESGDRANYLATQRTEKPLYLLLLFAGLTFELFKFRLYALLLLLAVLDQ